MSPPWVPPRPGYHLRVFAVSLAVLVAGLAGFLFGVRMEAVAPATGTVTARDLQDVRTVLAGLIEPGWYEAELPRPGGESLRARLDREGNGLTDPARGTPLPVHHYELTDGERRLRVKKDGVRFHRLEAGDELWPGQVLASVRADDWRFQLEQVEARLRQWESSGYQGTEYERARSEREALRHQLGQAAVRVPAEGDLWLAVRVHVALLQAVRAGDAVAAVVPLDPQTRRPRDLVARLDVGEKHFGSLEPGQVVRLDCPMYGHRLHGYAEARIERLGPCGEAGPDGQRRFHAVAPLTHAPFALPLGAGFKAEVVVGRKLVYRIILDY
jgi:hypothetical protein